MNRFFLFLSVLYLFLGSAPGFSQVVSEDLIEFELWTGTEKAPSSLEAGENYYLTEKEIYTEILKEAAWIVSGMIYGLDVVYTPYDSSRQVSEYLEVEPAASIDWGDPRLSIADSWFRNGKLYLQIRYFPDDAQKVRIKMWKSNLYPDAGGEGTVSVFEGEKGRLESVKEAVKEALRNYLRIREKNKPREIVGRIFFSEAPYITLDAGGYRSRVRITVKLDEVVPYKYY